MLPSLSLLPLPSKVTIPGLTVWSGPASAVGGEFGITVITTVSVAVAPSLSVTVSVSVCVPAVKLLFVNDTKVLKVVPLSCHR